MIDTIPFPFRLGGPQARTLELNGIERPLDVPWKECPPVGDLVWGEAAYLWCRHANFSRMIRVVSRIVVLDDSGERLQTFYIRLGQCPSCRSVCWAREKKP